MGLERLPEGVAATPHGAVELAGFPGPIEVLRADRRAQAPDRNDTGELWTRTPFI